MNSHKGHMQGPETIPSDKPKDFKGSIGRLISYCRPYTSGMILCIILSIISSVFSLIGPGRLSQITNLISEGITGDMNIELISQISLFLAIIYILSFAFGYMQGFIMSTIAQNISKKLRYELSIKINKLPLKYFDLKSYGDTLSRVTNDVDTIATTLNQSLSSLISAVIMFLGSLFLMFKTNWIMAIAGLLATLIGFLLMIFIISRSQKYFMSLQSQLGSLNGHIDESYSGHNIISAYNSQNEAISKFDEINTNLYQSTWKSQFTSGLMPPIMAFIGNFGYVVVCIVGAVLALSGQIPFGTIVAFMVYIRLFSQPLSQLAQVATSLQSTAAASERVFELLSTSEQKDESHKDQKLENVQGNVNFCNVHFGYIPDKIIINDFCAEIKSGQKVAIVGPTGAGKTTLVNLLMRFYELNSGCIKIDGTDTNAITRENLHELFCMVLQDTWIFEGTIKENIIYSKPGITDEDVIRVCKSVGLHHFIKTLPHGYDTVLNDKANLSSGQRQLITIARAMIDNAPLLILDEATSSVDTRTEILIQNSMDKLCAGKTSFVIAHRLSTIKNSDIIFVMKDGDIIESGNHEELLAQNGFYSHLWNSQFQK